MYHIFLHSNNKGMASINHSGAVGEKPKKSSKDVNHDALVVLLLEEGADQEDQHHGDLKLAATAPQQLRRSLSCNIYSTFTRAAGTPDHGSLEMSRPSPPVVLWEMGKCD
jgi:hypothetical protein